MFAGYAETGEVPVFGANSILPKEHGGKFFNLPIIRYLENEVGAVANWDSSIHDSISLNRVTPSKNMILISRSRLFKTIYLHFISLISNC